jgi:hypothetical protein
MRKIYLLLCALIAVNFVNAQTFRAGQTIEGGYYYDLDPDSLIVGEHYEPPGVYNLDINHDGIVDFEIKAIDSGGNGGYYNRCEIVPKNNNEVALGENDTVFGSPGVYDPPYIASIELMTYAFQYDETINTHPEWADSTLLLRYSTWVMYLYEGGCTAFPSNDLYLGVKVFCSPDTIYGWVKVKDVYSTHLKIESFACNKSSYSSVEDNRENEFRVYPNPAKTDVIIETPNITTESSVSIININGQILKQQKLTNTITSLDISDLSNGVYFAKYISEDKTQLVKIIKE